MNQANPGENPGRLGVWLIGARGAISTCVAYGLTGLAEGLLEPTGIATATAPFTSLPLRPFDSIVLGGHEVVTGGLDRSARELVRSGVLSAELVAAGAGAAAAYDARIRPGLLDGPDVGLADLDPRASRLGASSLAEQVARLTADLLSFASEHELERVVVVNLASTEAWREHETSWDELASFERALEEGGDVPASSLYAYAAFKAGFPYVNFTPNRGASLPALLAMAEERGIPHCGNDGKTGETLVKTALAPMFAARALRVLAWQGYNMLGNRDGEALADPVRKEAKQRNKDAVLRSILGDELHSLVGIDLVPSLHDWKTAWDFIHFEGFLDAKMSLQFTWQGSDSALAAPLIIDLVRLADFAAAKGESGTMAHTAGYFKSPLSEGTHDFHAQFRTLLEYVERHLSS